MKSKYKGIDERVIKCANPFNHEDTIESGISIDDVDSVPVLRFHFLEKLKFKTIEQKWKNPEMLTQTTKLMFLSKENRDQLVKELKSIKFKK